MLNHYTNYLHVTSYTIFWRDIWSQKLKFFKTRKMIFFFFLLKIIFIKFLYLSMLKILFLWNNIRDILLSSRLYLPFPTYFLFLFFLFFFWVKSILIFWHKYYFLYELKSHHKTKKETYTTNKSVRCFSIFFNPKMSDNLFFF